MVFAMGQHESATGVHCPLPTSLRTPPRWVVPAPALGALLLAWDLHWLSLSYMVIYMFQLYSLKSSHPRLLPLSPKVCSLHLCLDAELFLTLGLVSRVGGTDEVVRSEGGELVRRLWQREQAGPTLPLSRISLLSHILPFPYKHSLPCASGACSPQKLLREKTSDDGVSFSFYC